MAEEKLLVKRDGEFCYPIYFENDFSFLSQALTDEGLAGKSMCIVSDSTVFFLIQKKCPNQIEHFFNLLAYSVGVHPYSFENTFVK